MHGARSQNGWPPCRRCRHGVQSIFQFRELEALAEVVEHTLREVVLDSQLAQSGGMSPDRTARRDVRRCRPMGWGDQTAHCLRETQDRGR